MTRLLVFVITALIAGFLLAAAYSVSLNLALAVVAYFCLLGLIAWKI